MATELIITEATVLHALELERTLRQGELTELQAQGFASPAQALALGLRDSAESYSVLYDGKVVGMFGVALERHGSTMLGGVDVGSLWFLTGDGFERAAWRGLRLARRILAALLERYAELRVLIDARYDAAFRWARRLGFEVLEGMPFGPDDCLFHLAVLRRS